MLNKTEWGNATWDMLHSISFKYPYDPSKEEQNAFISLIKSLQYLLPCVYCKEHWTKFLSENLKDNEHNIAKNKRSASEFLVYAHNHVNTQLGKPTFTYTQAEAKYDNPNRMIQEKEERDNKRRNSLFKVGETGPKGNIKSNIVNVGVLFFVVILVIILLIIGKVIRNGQ